VGERRNPEGPISMGDSGGLGGGGERWIKVGESVKLKKFDAS